MDKYVAELEKAREKASFVPSDIRWRVPYLKFLGVVQGQRGNMYYYYDKAEDKYYYESEFDREMRVIIQKKKFKNYTKK